MKWVLITTLVVQAHFAASYLVPLDAPAAREFGGLLRWFWPWEVGQRGVFGIITEAGPPGAGLFLALGAAGLSILAVMALFGWWVPLTWWRPLAIGGGALAFALMLAFFGLTKLLPIALCLTVLWLAWHSTPDLGATP